MLKWLNRKRGSVKDDVVSHSRWLSEHEDDIDELRNVVRLIIYHMPEGADSPFCMGCAAISSRAMCKAMKSDYGSIGRPLKCSNWAVIKDPNCPGWHSVGTP